MADLLFLFGAVLIVSLISLVGILTLGMRKGLLNKILYGLVSFAAGAMIAAGLFDLLPESENALGASVALPIVAAGIVSFFVLEKFVYWTTHFHRPSKSSARSFAYMNLVGDSLHNFLDGIAMAAAFTISTPLGIVTTLAVILHEIPQEIGDFGVLVYGGFAPSKAVFYNFLVALMAFAGAIAGVLAAGRIEGAVPIMLAFSAGGFLYIGAADMLPELHKETSAKRSVVQLALLIAGMLVIWLGAGVV
ncbi:MAG TPA: ZIP family metal transporter [Candidatus Norongarragalinales archaeon]|jgi:zinc and cadmium transporter|nr:ZIP family metal transporter [Candidatus Norongarragalinales archaeon]